MYNDLSTQILVADTDPFRVAIYEQHLRNLGYTNINAFTGEQTFVGREQGIIFIDVSIAAHNSYAVIQNIKQSNPANYIVLITSKENMHQAEQALKYGAFDLVIKGKYLFTTISEVLENIRRSQLQYEANAMQADMEEPMLYLHPDGSIDGYYW